MEALLMTAPGGHQPLLAPDHHDDPYRALERNLGVSLGLTEEEKNVLDARVVSGLSFREVGDMLGCAASTAHKVYHETIKKIQTATANHQSGSDLPGDCGRPEPEEN
jgi:DNA-directed RNA polymerase specialized sigma24 family protein